MYMKINRLILILLVIFFLTGCQVNPVNNPTIEPTQIPPTVTTIPPSATPLSPTVPPIPKLTIDQLKNSTYITPQYNKTVALVNGKYENGSGADYLQMNLLPQIAFGDLNGDGVEDAAVLLAENGGGSGVFVSLVVVLNNNGKPEQFGAALIDDRPVIKDLSIAGGKINLAAVIHNINDPMCCPSKDVIQVFQINKIGLKLVHFASKVSNGAERTISITSPLNGTQVSGSVLVVGNMPMAPFENTLGYRIYDDSANQLAEGSFMVNSADMGAPATISTTINLPSVPDGTIVWLELREVSMADGSIIALSAVRLIIQ
jgi:hypothetical protein